MIGGCCGTTPEHIRWMVNSTRMLSGRSAPTTVERTANRRKPTSTKATPLDPVPFAERSKLAEKIARGEFVVSVEVNPAPGLDPTSSALDAAQMLLANGVDTVNVADGPRAMARMSNLAFCSLLIEAPRHRADAPRLRSRPQPDRADGALARRARHRHPQPRRHHGRSPKVGDYPEATAVYDLDSIGLLQDGERTMNRGKDPAGKPLPGGKTAFLCATGVEPGAADLEREIRRLEHKGAAGADLVMTQPIFQTELLDEVLRRIAHLGMPVLIGVLPLVSYKNAEFLHNEVPGMQIPDAIRERMRGVAPGSPRAKRA
jgi:5,10-methylenetetrahydrofolate reductase